MPLRKNDCVLRAKPAPGQTKLLRRLRAKVTPVPMGCLRQSPLRRSRTRAPLSRPLHSPRSHLQSSIAPIRRRHRHLPLARLRPRKRATGDDPSRRGVHPPVPASRPAEGLCPHPALWLHGQLPAFGILRTFPPTAGNGAGPSLSRNPFDRDRTLVSRLSGAHDCHRQADPSPDRVEIPFDMFPGYVVAEPKTIAHLTCLRTPMPTCARRRFIVSNPNPGPPRYFNISTETPIHCRFDLPFPFPMSLVPSPHQPAFPYFLHGLPRPPQTPPASY